MLSRTQNSLNTLIQDYGKLENENKSLKETLSELEKEIGQSSQALTNEISENPINEQLKSEVFSLEQKISSLGVQFMLCRTYSEEMSLLRRMFVPSGQEMVWHQNILVLF